MEHISTTTLIITLIVMVIISAYFSGSETGMMTLNRYRLRHMAKQGNRPAKRVEKLLRKPDRLISLVLIGNNLVNILASALGIWPRRLRCRRGVCLQRPSGSR